MESTATAKKIFRARKTMNPSSRHQIESLNKLKKIWVKERTSEETDKESKTEQLNKSGPICKDSSFSTEILNLESAVSVSEEKDQPANNSKVSGVLCINPPTKDPCISNHHTEEKYDPPEVGYYNIVTSPISEASIGSPVRCNDSYDHEILNLESKVSISEEIENSAIDAEVFGIESPLNVCLPIKEKCNSNCRRAKSPNIAEQKPYKIDEPPVSQKSFGNSPICDNDFDNTFLNLEYKVPKTEEMDMFRSAGKISPEMLDTDSSVNISSPTKETCYSNPQTADFNVPPEDNPYILITSPISEASLGSPICESSFSQEFMDFESKVSKPDKVNSSTSGAKVSVGTLGFDLAANVGVPTIEEIPAIFRSDELPSSPKLKSSNIETKPISPQSTVNPLVCNKGSFGKEINNLESKASVSEQEMGQSPCKATVSAEEVGTESLVNVSLLANECNSDHLPGKLLDFPEVKPHSIKTLPVSPPSIGNGLLCQSKNISHEVLELKSKVWISKQIDSSPNKVEMSLDNLPGNSIVNVCFPMNDACHSVHDAAELPDNPEVKPYVTEMLPVSPQSLGNIPVCKDHKCSQEILNLESKLSISEDLDTTPVAEDESVEVLGINSHISVCLPAKEKCCSIHQLEELPDSPKVNQNNLESFSPISQQCIVNLNSGFDQELLESKVPLSSEINPSPSKVHMSAEVSSIDSLVHVCLPEENACHSFHQMAELPNSQKVKLCGTHTFPISPQSIGNSLICNNSTSGKESLHLNANVPILEQMDTSSSKINGSAEVLSIGSSVNVFLLDGACHSSHQTAESSDSPQVELYAVETSPNSQQCIDNPLIENSVIEMYEKKPHENLAADSSCDVNSKQQDSLSRRLHDMLVQEKILIATTASTALEVHKNVQAAKVTDQMDPTLEKFIVPLNLSEEDEDEGLLPTLDRMNANVDGNDLKQTDCAVNSLQDLHSSLDKECLSISSIHFCKDGNLASDLEDRKFSNSDLQAVKCLGKSKTFENNEMDVDTNNDPCDESGGKSISYLGVSLTFPPKDTFVRCLEKKDSSDSESVGKEGVSQVETIQSNLNCELHCKPLDESISCLEAEVADRSAIPFIESNNCSAFRKRLNSENEPFMVKRFRTEDDVSPVSKETKEIPPVSEETNGVSEKIKCLIAHQVQIFFADVFEHKLEQLTERIQVIQCGKKHEELVAKCLRKLRRFESHANIAIKRLKGMLRQPSMLSSVAEPKATVPVEDLSLMLNQKVLTEKPLTENPVDASATSKSPLSLCLKAVSPIQTPTSAPVVAAADPSALVHLRGANPTKSITPFSASTTPNSSDALNVQSVSPAVSITIGSFSQRTLGKETSLLHGRDYEYKSLPGKATATSLASNSPDLLNKDAATYEGNVLNVKLENQVVNDEIHAQSGMVIDLTDEERSATEAVPLTGQDAIMTNENLHLKGMEALGMKHLNPLPNITKLLTTKKYPQKSVERVKSLDSKTQANRQSDHDGWTTKKLKMDSMRISEYKANPKHGKLKYGAETRQPHQQSLGVDKRYMVPSATNKMNAGKTPKKLTPAKRTFDESRAMPMDSVSYDDRRGFHKAPTETLIVNRSLSVPSCSRSEKEFTPNTLYQASEHGFQTAAPPQLRTGVQDSLPPQKMELKLTQVQNPRGIALSWNCTKIDPKCCPAKSYCLYVQQEDASCSKDEWKWKRIGEIKALPLPMACTLSQFVGGSRYYFTIRAKDMHERYGPFAEVQSTTLLPLDKARTGT